MRSLTLSLFSAYAAAVGGACSGAQCAFDLGVGVPGLSNQMFGIVLFSIVVVAVAVVAGVASCLCCKGRYQPVAGGVKAGDSDAPQSKSKSRKSSQRPVNEDADED